jgi:PDZ domain-containing protein
VQDGDVLVGLNGATLGSFSDLSRAVDAIPPGGMLTLHVLRAGVPMDLPVKTTDDGHGRSLIGVLVDPTFTMPVDVKIRISDIGGPSAGTMFALGIIDKLTAEDLANGVVIAGTGTMDLTGRVGPIGGIEQKMAGAVGDGATWFLAPAENCGDVVGHVPSGLHVVRVATLHEARLAVQAIGADPAAAARTLPTCTAG